MNISLPRITPILSTRQINGVARSTLGLVEKGSLHVSVSIYVQALYRLGFERELKSIPKKQAW